MYPERLGGRDADGWFTPAGRKLRTEIEEFTDALAAPAYTCLEPHEVDELITDLGPVVAKVNADRPLQLR